MTDNKETLKDKLKNLWSLRGSSPKSPSVNLSKNTIICDDFWLDISASQPIEVRIEKLKDATKVVESDVLDDCVMKRLWLETKDLLQPETRYEMRIMELRFIQSIIKGQYRRLGLMRAVFFQALREHSNVEDLPEVVKTFESLTDNGKDAEHFEQELGPCLIDWLSKMKRDTTLLSLLINIIKFNSSYLDEDTITSMLKFVSDLCKSKCEEQERKLGLQVVDAVICYSALPHGSLNSITIMLCYTLNMKKFCNQSWILMRKLLGTHLGHSCISIMCSLLQNPKFLPEWPLLRSAVFFIGMGLWGSVRVKTLKRTPQSVLPSFNRALLTKNEELALEVALTIQRLVCKYGHELQGCTWDHVLDILVSLFGVMDKTHKKEIPSSVSLSLQTATHEIITFIEKLVESEVYDGAVDRLFAITERCVTSRPTESVFLLISYKLRAINPSKQNWIPNILLLVETFYKKESRNEIRLKVLEILSMVIEESMDLYEEELVNEVLVISFQDVAKEKNLSVKTKCLELLFQACLLSDNEVVAILKLIEGALPINWMEKCIVSPDKDDSKHFVDVDVLITGLIKVFEQKMYRCPGSNAVLTYNLLIMFLRRIYSDVMVSSITSNISLMDSRKRVFKTLLSLRANEKGTIFPYGAEQSNILSSLVVSPQTSDKDDTRTGTDDSGFLQFQNTLECVISCLEKDNSWSVVDCVLTQLKEILQNKFILTGNSKDSDYACLPYIDKIATVLCAMTTDAELTKIKSYNQEIAKYDMQAAVISVLSSVICYHRWLGMSHQRQILRCLETGFVSRCARLCVQTVTLCIVEMPQDALLRLLPSILSRLTQMSSTVHLSTAVLGLLAVLAQMPGLFMNFVEEQYKSIFAVALQYTDPSRFSRYVVSLAHFVVGTWFTNCRMSFRLEFVGFITRNLQSVNRADSTASNAKSVEAIRNNLMESCIDMMAQHTFSNGSFMPKRSPLAKFMFDGGSTAAWIVGNKLITITTSSTGKLHNITSKLTSPQRTVAFEAPANLSSSAFTPVVSSARQRHKSGGAILKQSDSQFLDSNVSAQQDSGSENLPVVGMTEEGSAFNLQQWLTSGWAEIYVRRPNGNCAWSMRIQNRPNFGDTFAENALNFQSALEEIGIIPKKGLKKDRDTGAADLDAENSSKFTSTDQNTLPPTKQHRSLSTSDEPVTMDYTTSPDLPDELFQPDSDSSSTEPQLRLRSHTLSTSKDCDVETAATAARYKAERKKYQQLRQQEVRFDDSPTRRPASVFGMQSPLFQQDNSVRSRVSIDKRNEITSPSYVFLQLFQSACWTESIHRPILLPRTPAIERSVQVLDRIPPHDTWCTGVIYVGPNDGGNGDAILSNEGGSPRYQEFLKGLGELVSLPECDPVSTFLGGLDTKGEDGEFTYVWKEEVLQMAFHVTTLMPVRSDLAFKKRHIGNDYVIIAYDDDNGNYVPGCTVKGQFRSAELVISPLGKQTNHVRYVFHKELVEKAVGPDAGPWLISDKHLPVLVRQLALHACMAAYVSVGEGANADEYSSKALARLKQIKRIRSRAMQEIERDGSASKSNGSKRPVTTPEEGGKLEEFSDYVR